MVSFVALAFDLFWSGCIIQFTTSVVERLASHQYTTATIIETQLLHNKWASRNQFHQYYIYGKFQDCSMYSKAMKSCISYKATKSTEDRDIMLEALKTQEIKFTSASVWEKRENPARPSLEPRPPFFSLDRPTHHQKSRGNGKTKHFIGMA
ncbi:uncharacterized protein LOC114976824 isoform X1 [Acropora millepora]|uniref:uncharacterized protein LOC114976824 isoform X1 n=1 Tax=Acropora millepora TaxID=45264 RepID=UPI001CF2A424|nr:uncharacterized protein LOC114976824 isoform X1 [Acropora millepora]